MEALSSLTETPLTALLAEVGITHQVGLIHKPGDDGARFLYADGNCIGLATYPQALALVKFLRGKVTSPDLLAALRDALDTIGQVAPEFFESGEGQDARAALAKAAAQ